MWGEKGVSEDIRTFWFFPSHSRPVDPVYPVKKHFFAFIGLGHLMIFPFPKTYWSSSEKKWGQPTILVVLRGEFVRKMMDGKIIVSQKGTKVNGGLWIVNCGRWDVGGDAVRC
jgi:hypothetical protein